jgi:GH15 family glucan-1,4-alpha-glucosidase
VIGDGRTAALVARDGTIDWLCLPDLDSPSVFAAILDADVGGAFVLQPDGPHEAHRRYLPNTNVLETTFTTAGGVVRVTDALTLPVGGLTPFRELARRIEGVSGCVPMRWRVEPRFGYGAWPTRIGRRGEVAVATARGDALGVCAWDAGIVRCDARSIGGSFEARAGDRALLVLVAARREPLVIPGRAAVERRLDATAVFWRQWAEARDYRGPWRETVLRSALALKLLVYAPSGALAAAPTTSLPERIGGERNWDYRYCWLRDASFTLEALLQLGCTVEADSFFWWFMHATRLTKPQLQVLYRLDGGARVPERVVGLAGYRGSRPVRTGNGAATQRQLDVYGDLLDTAWVYTDRGGRLDRETGAELAEVADLVCKIWREPDRGIWEVRMDPVHYTHSKAMCWVALDRALKLAATGHVPGGREPRWQREAAAIRDFIETRCWSDKAGSYARSAGTDEVDAALLMMAIMRYHDPRDPRMLGTIEAVRRHLGSGPFLYRYAGDDGLSSGEGAFLCCSFWLVEALALAGRHDDASRLMESLLARANDVGLYAEEIDPASGEFLGNFPQGLVHLALISAAMCFTPAERG